MYGVMTCTCQDRIRRISRRDSGAPPDRGPSIRTPHPEIAVGGNTDRGERRKLRAAGRLLQVRTAPAVGKPRGISESYEFGPAPYMVRRVATLLRGVRTTSFPVQAMTIRSRFSILPWALALALIHCARPHRSRRIRPHQRRAPYQFNTLTTKGYRMLTLTIYGTTSSPGTRRLDQAHRPPRRRLP